MRGAFRHHYLVRFRINALSIIPRRGQAPLKEKRQDVLPAAILNFRATYRLLNKNPATLISANDPK